MDNLCDLSDEEVDNKADAVHTRPPQSTPAMDGMDKTPVVTTTSCLSTSPLMSPNTSKTLLPQQAIRSELRRDFLRLLSSLHKRKVWLKLYECPLLLSATFDGCDHDLSQVFVTSFETPIGLEKCAIVRTADVCELHFDITSHSQQQQH